MVVLARLLDCDPDGVDAAHLPRADADRREILRDDDRVRRHVLADAHREHEVAPLPLVHGSGHGLPAGALFDLRVGVLDEQPAEDALVLTGIRTATPALVIGQDSDVLTAAQRLERRVAVARCEQHLDELPRELGAERLVDVAVDDDDAAVRADGVARERFVVRLFDRCADADTARVRVLDDDARR
jgi:hypothetical protein